MKLKNHYYSMFSGLAAALGSLFGKMIGGEVKLNVECCVVASSDIFLSVAWPLGFSNKLHKKFALKWFKESASESKLSQCIK